RHRGELLELGAGRVGDDPCKRRLAGSGWPVEDERRDAVRFDRAAERSTRAEHVLLPDELVERLRAQSLRQRRELLERAPRPLVEEVRHAAQYARGREG